MRTLISFILIIVVFAACNSEGKRLKEALQGEWSPVIDSSEIVISPIDFIPFGRAFCGDSMEFFPGYYELSMDTNSRKNMFVYKGNFRKYKIESNNIYLKDSKGGSWDKLFEIVNVTKDTITVKYDDEIGKFYRLTYHIDTVANFDQIIYSNSGCYGTCSIMDISVDKSGNVIFIGEGYVRPLGFFEGRANKKQVDYIFNKFKKANPFHLSSEYICDHTDDQSQTVTFIKEGKVVKTIEDYGGSAPKELLWAFVPISGLHTMIDLNELPADEPFYPILHNMTLEKEGMILKLKKSIGFYLWTELKKSKIVDVDFKSKYKIVLLDNLLYVGPNPNKNRKHTFEISKIETDGRYYRYVFRDRGTIVYDLGYDFIERNLASEQFSQPEEWEKLFLNN